MERIKATITKSNHDGKIRQNRKEDHFIEEYSVIVNDRPRYEGDSKMQCIASLRLYGTGRKNYACLWVRGRKKDIYISGGGSAGGYGYHRPSAAAQDAISDAGIKLDCSIDGRGDTAIEEAMKAIAVALGYRSCYIHKAHA